MNFWKKLEFKLINEKKIISFLVSGSGLNFSIIAKKIQKNEIPAMIGTVVTDNEGAGVILRSKSFGIKSYFIDPEIHKPVETFDKQIITIFERYHTDLVVTAGYLRLLSPLFIDRYRNRIINVHPSLLPSFPGMRSQKRALEFGSKITGCTTHFVNEGIDTGPIILQSPVSIFENDTVSSLSQRILKEEFKILPETIKLFCENRLRVIGGKVLIDY